MKQRVAGYSVAKFWQGLLFCLIVDCSTDMYLMNSAVGSRNTYGQW
jgi:hypothetical protein